MKNLIYYVLQQRHMVMTEVPVWIASAAAALSSEYKE